MNHSKSILDYFRPYPKNESSSLSSDTFFDPNHPDMKVHDTPSNSPKKSKLIFKIIKDKMKKRLRENEAILKYVQYTKKTSNNKNYNNKSNKQINSLLNQEEKKKKKVVMCSLFAKCSNVPKKDIDNETSKILKQVFTHPTTFKKKNYKN